MSTSGEETDLGILPKLGHQIALIYDLLSGPPMTEQQRINRALAESDAIRKWERFSI
ncbi:MAG: hypothetical protein MK034_00655 [Dehalococcoidia bacterium]|nr:hypothetical protein [Dehalococcoidia bacterium]